jgi:hypothetical protein
MKRLRAPKPSILEYAWFVGNAIYQREEQLDDNRNGEKFHVSAEDFLREHLQCPNHISKAAKELRVALQPAPAAH